MNDTATALHHFAQSWGLLAMVLVFVAAVLYALRPSSRTIHAEAAAIPLERGDDLEADVKAAEKHNRKPQQEART